MDVGLDQHAGDAARGIDAENLDVLPAERLAELLEPGVAAAWFERAGTGLVEIRLRRGERRLPRD